jgi:hypothetical protein
MAYFVKYRCEFDTIKGRKVKIDIEEDTLSAPTVINLTASSESPLEISYPNGEFEKMCPIRESKVRFKILNDVVTAEDFYITSDTQFKVKIYINNVLEWAGWLDNNIITELFLDTKNEIELSANDGLSLLKTKMLVDSLDDQIWQLIGVNNLLAVVLYHTKLELNYSTYINLYPENSPIRVASTQLKDVFDDVYLYSQTFLTGPRDFDDCYKVLSKIMQGFGCTIYQARGQWYIVQTNDRIANVLDGTNRDYTGARLSVSLNQSFKIDIGLNEITKLINADALTSIEQPFKEVVITHKYDVPPVYFRNIDFLDRTSGAKLLYWDALPTALALFYGYVNDGDVYIDLESGTNAEIRRYSAFQVKTSSRSAWGKRSSVYPVNQGDIISFGYSVRYTTGYFKGGAEWTYVIFQRSDGQIFYLNLDGGWYTSFKSVGYTYNPAEDRNFWKSYGITSQPVPGTGTISIGLVGDQNVLLTTGDWIFKYYKDIEFSIKTSFNELTAVDGHEYKCEQTQSFKNIYDNELFVSDAPNISTQGSLMLNAFDKATNYKYKNVTATILTFGKYITRAYWRTMYRRFLRLEGRLYDLYQGNRLLSPLNSVEFTEIEDKEFMITTLQMDVRQESSEFTMIELRNTLNNNDFTQNGTESFRYLNVKAKDENDPIKEPKTPIDWKFGTLGVISSLIRRNKRRRFNNYS